MTILLEWFYNTVFPLFITILYSIPILRFIKALLEWFYNTVFPLFIATPTNIALNISIVGILLYL